MQSPCILICSIDDKSGYCHGCGRTRDEIGKWSLYSDAERSSIMDGLQQRLDTLEKRPRRVTKRQAMADARANPKTGAP